MNNVEKYTQAILRNLPLDTQGVTSSEDDKFYEVAAAIVEPIIEDEEVSEEYSDFVESNSENWAHWIRQTFGDNWGVVATIVAEEGY